MRREESIGVSPTPPWTGATCASMIVARYSPEEKKVPVFIHLAWPIQPRIARSIPTRTKHSRHCKLGLREQAFHACAASNCWPAPCRIVDFWQHRSLQSNIYRPPHPSRSVIVSGGGPPCPLALSTTTLSLSWSLHALSCRRPHQRITTALAKARVTTGRARDKVIKLPLLALLASPHPRSHLFPSSPTS